jgi:nucleoside-diphosphate-sugar epimerase
MFMKLLILGGTRFLGRHMAEAALRGGCEVTLFHRGQTNPGLFPAAEELLGDRDGGLGALGDRVWDSVIDVNGYVPRLVRDSARRLKDRTERYVFVSTLSVLGNPAIPNQDEGAALAKPPDASVEEITKDTYGGLKAACEIAVQGEIPGRALIVRPGFVVGPWDYTGRFNYWLRRFKEGGEMLVPGEPSGPLQFIDVRDLAEFVVKMARSKGTGIYHAVGPREPLSWGALFDECRAVTRSDTRVTWIREEILESLGVQPSELPMWVGSDARGIMRSDFRNAVAAGLTFRPVAETVRDVLDWDAKHGRTDVGLDRARERELLSAWKESLSRS